MNIIDRLGRILAYIRKPDVTAQEALAQLEVESCSKQRLREESGWCSHKWEEGPSYLVSSYYTEENIIITFMCTVVCTRCLGQRVKGIRQESMNNPGLEVDLNNSKRAPH